MNARTLVGGIFAVLWLTALPTWAVEYRLQVANIDDQVFASYEGKARSWTDMKEPMGRLAERLDDNQFSRNAILPGHHVEVVQDPAYGGITPKNISLLPAYNYARSHEDWTTYVFDANPGDTVVFVVTTDMVAWQQDEDVAANVKGKFRRLSIGGPGIFGGAREVPQVSQDFLANAADRGTFPQWVAQNAKSLDGMSFVVGQGDDPYYDADRVYIVLKLPAQPHTFQVVLGWQNNDESQL
jgi:hypothetical protein